MMEYRGYLGRVVFDGDSRTLHGEVVGIRDVVTFQGKSVHEIEKAFRDSVDDYLDFCAKRGEPPDKPYSGQFVVRIGPELHRQANLIAAASGKSLNALVVDAVSARLKEEALRKRGKKRVKRSRRHQVK